YALADIYNADETGLYYRTLPERSMVVRGDPRKGIKTSKERVTVLLTCSAAGEKLKPLLIGKSLKPRHFKGIDKAALPITYRANRKAWMTSVLFKEWLDKLNSKMKLQGRNILLFVDNCGAHPEVKLTNVKMVFLPPNTTSRLQPCDAGIIAALKAHY
ncbi:Tigger transposable element-derived protein 6, partial [Lamellibrachia satsuma]